MSEKYSFCDVLKSPLAVGVLAALPIGPRGTETELIALEVRQCDGRECSVSDVHRHVERAQKAGIDAHIARKQGKVWWRPTRAQRDQLEKAFNKYIDDSVEEICDEQEQQGAASGREREEVTGRV